MKYLYVCPSVYQSTFKTVPLALLDLSTAFNTVDHCILFLLRPGPYAEKKFGGGFGNEAPKAPRTSRRRRRDRDAERVEGVGYVEG